LADVYYEIFSSQTSSLTRLINRISPLFPWKSKAYAILVITDLCNRIYFASSFMDCNPDLALD
jgi:hypothetical protein